MLASVSPLHIFLENSNLLFSVALRLTNSKEDSEDLLQDLAIKIQRNPSLLKNSDNPKAYLVKTLNNLFIDQWRSIKSKPHYRAESLDDSYDDHQSTQPNSIEEQVDQQQLLSTIEKALSTIPESLRLVITLFDIEGFTLAEVAEITDSPVGTIKSRLHRARNMIRESLKSLQPFDDK